MSVLLFFVAVIFNAWFISLLSSPLSLLCIVLSCVFIARQPSKKVFYVISILILTLLQLRHSPVVPQLTNDALSQHNRFQQMRAYPFISLPIAYWVEERAELRLVDTFVQRGAVLVSPNYYFFANHPRSRPSVTETEKFPLALLPFAILGILISIRKQRYIVFLTGFIAVLFALPLLMYPLVATGIYEGLRSVFVKPDKRFVLFVILLLVTLLIQYVFTKY